MSIEHRYEMVLADLISLLQSALLRFLSQSTQNVMQNKSMLKNSMLTSLNLQNQ